MLSCQAGSTPTPILLRVVVRRQCGVQTPSAIAPSINTTFGTSSSEFGYAVLVVVPCVVRVKADTFRSISVGLPSPPLPPPPSQTHPPRLTPRYGILWYAGRGGCSKGGFGFGTLLNPRHPWLVIRRYQKPSAAPWIVITGIASFRNRNLLLQLS